MTMDAKEIKKRAEKRPVTDEHPQKRNYKLLQEELDLIDELTDKYGKTKVNDTEVVRAAIRAFDEMPKDKGLELIFNLPKVKPGPKPKK